MSNDVTEVMVANEIPSLTPKQLEQLERKRQREQEQIERQKRKEAERIEKEKRKAEREKERLEKKAKAEELKKRRMEEQLERQAKKRKLEEEKEAERKRKAEEKERKMKEKEAKQKEKEAKQKEKEAKQKEKEAKDRQQTKISGFFTVQKKQKSTEKAKENEAKSLKSDYETFFLPFYVKPGCVVSELGRLSSSELEQSISDFDSQVFGGQKKGCDLFYKPQLISKHENPMSAELLFTKISTNSISLEEVLEALAAMPVRYLRFYENNKPPFCSTFTRTSDVSPVAPFGKISGIDYEYDSDFEEEEEGDEVDAEDEEEEEIDNEEDDDEFIEKEAEPVRRTNKYVDNLVPEVQTTDLEEFKAILIATEGPGINPFKDYWGNSGELTVKDQDIKTDSDVTKAVEVTTNVLVGRKKQGSMIENEEDLKKMKEFISLHNSLTLQAMIDMILLELPQYRKNQIRSTLLRVAEKRGIGSKKVWVVK